MLVERSGFLMTKHLNGNVIHITWTSFNKDYHMTEASWPEETA